MVALIPLAACKDVGQMVPLGELWGTAIGFILLLIAVTGAVGIGSRNLAVGSVGAYLMLSYLTLATELQLLETVLYATLPMLIIATAFKMWRVEGFEGG